MIFWHWILHHVVMSNSLFLLLNGVLFISNESYSKVISKLDKVILWHFVSLVVLSSLEFSLLLSSILIISHEFAKSVSLGKAENKGDKSKFVHFIKYYIKLS